MNKNNDLRCHAGVIERSYNDDMGRLDIARALERHTTTIHRRPGLSSVTIQPNQTTKGAGAGHGSAMGALLVMTGENQ
jgi:hypothetical protein